MLPHIDVGICRLLILVTVLKNSGDALYCTGAYFVEMAVCSLALCLGQALRVQDI